MVETQRCRESKEKVERKLETGATELEKIEGKCSPAERIKSLGDVV